MNTKKSDRINLSDEQLKKVTAGRGKGDTMDGLTAICEMLEEEEECCSYSYCEWTGISCFDPSRQ